MAGFVEPVPFDPGVVFPIVGLGPVGDHRERCRPLSIQVELLAGPLDGCKPFPWNCLGGGTRAAMVDILYEYSCLVLQGGYPGMFLGTTNPGSA